MERPLSSVGLEHNTLVKEHIERNLYSEWWLTNRSLSDGDIGVGDGLLNHRNV